MCFCIFYVESYITVITQTLMVGRFDEVILKTQRWYDTHILLFIVCQICQCHWIKEFFLRLSKVGVLVYIVINTSIITIIILLINGYIRHFAVCYIKKPQIRTLSAVILLIVFVIVCISH